MSRNCCSSSARDGEDDLAELLACLHALVRGTGLGEREDGVYNRAGAAARDELVSALEILFRAHRRAVDRQLFPPEAVERRRRVRPARRAADPGAPPRPPGLPGAPA